MRKIWPVAREWVAAAAWLLLAVLFAVMVPSFIADVRSRETDVWETARAAVFCLLAVLAFLGCVFMAVNDWSKYVAYDETHLVVRNLLGTRMFSYADIRRIERTFVFGRTEGIGWRWRDERR